jgi:hypothetical protein
MVDFPLPRLIAREYLKWGEMTLIDCGIMVMKHIHHDNLAQSENILK